jgi:hypothetical protein
MPPDRPLTRTVGMVCPNSGPAPALLKAAAPKLNPLYLKNRLRFMPFLKRPLFRFTH